MPSRRVKRPLFWFLPLTKGEVRWGFLFRQPQTSLPNPHHHTLKIPVYICISHTKNGDTQSFDKLLTERVVFLCDFSLMRWPVYFNGKAQLRAVKIHDEDIYADLTTESKTMNLLSAKALPQKLFRWRRDTSQNTSLFEFITAIKDLGHVSALDKTPPQPSPS